MSGVCEYCKVRYAGETCSSCSYRLDVMAARASAARPTTVQLPPVNGLPHQPVSPAPDAQQTPVAASPSQAPYGQPTPTSYLAQQAAPAYGSSKFIGDAQPIPGMPLSRILNALCYVVAGIAMIVISAQPRIPVAAPLLIGLAFIAYGIKIAVTRGSYWMASFIYVLAIGAVLAMFGVLSR
jgi:hypothetical protein